MAIAEIAAGIAIVISTLTFFRNIFQTEKENAVLHERLDTHIRFTEKSLESIALKIEKLVDKMDKQ